MPFFGAASASDCIPCLAGFTCGSATTDTPTTKCTQGFYCPAGGIEIKCPKGSICPQTANTGAETYTMCDVGTFNDDE